MLAELSILVICFLFQMSAQISKPFVSLLAQSLAAGNAMIGLIVAIQALLPLVLAVPIGRVIDNLGARKVLFVGSILTVASGVFYFKAQGVLVLFLAQVLSGIGQLLLWLAVQTVATQIRSGISARDSYVGYFGAFSAAGQSLAPILGGVTADAWGYQAALVSLIVPGILIFLGSFLVPPLPVAGKEYSKGPLLSSYNEAWHLVAKNLGIQMAVIASFVPIIVSLIKVSFLPLYLISIGFSNTAMGVILALGSLAAIFCRASMRGMIGLISRRGVLFASAFLALVPMAVISFFHGFWPIAVLATLSGWGQGINEPMSITLVAAYTESRKRGMAMGLRVASNKLAQFVAPLLFAAFMEAHGLARAFLDTGYLLFLWSLGSIAFASWHHLGPDLGVEKKSKTGVACS